MAENKAMNRINRLLDPGSFVEIGAQITSRMTSFTMDQQQVASDGVITGYGLIDGNPVFVYCQDRDVLNGTMGEMHATKIANLYDWAMKTCAPVIGLIDCGGFRLQESVDALDGFGALLKKQVEANGCLTQICGVLGTCAGGMTMVPALCDFVYMAKDSRMFVNAPHTLTDDPALARNFKADMFQNEISGQAEVVATEEEVLSKIRDLVLMLVDDTYGCCEEEELNRYVTVTPSKDMDVRELIGQCADNGLFIELRGSYCPEMVTGFMKLNGIRVGVIANAPAIYDKDGKRMEGTPKGLTAAGCAKAAAFVRYCDSQEMPVLTIVAADGFASLVDTEIRMPIALAELVKAYSECWSTKINLIVGDTYGTAYLAMNAKSIGGADLAFCWDTVKIGMMNAESAANILDAKGDASERGRQAQAYDALQNAGQTAASRGSIDAVIAPRDTRKHLIMAFSVV